MCISVLRSHSSSRQTYCLVYCYTKPRWKLRFN